MRRLKRLATLSRIARFYRVVLLLVVLLVIPLVGATFGIRASRAANFGCLLFYNQPLAMYDLMDANTGTYSIDRRFFYRQFSTVISDVSADGKYVATIFNIEDPDLPVWQHSILVVTTADYHDILLKRVGADNVKWSPDGSQLAYSRYDGVTGKQWIVLARPDGSEAREIQPGNDELRLADWSPDGKFVLFVTKQSKIFVSAADGQLTTFGGDNSYPGVWAPGSHRLAYFEQGDEDDGKVRLVVLAPDESPRRIIVPYDANTLPDLSWSNHGARLLLDSSPDDQHLNYSIYRDDGDVLSWTADVKRAWISTDAAPNPVWSADGRFLAFAQISKYSTGIGETVPTYEFTILNVDENRLETLVPDPKWTASYYMADDTANFASPDGKRLAVRWRSNQDGTLGLDLLDPDGTDRVTLIQNAYWIESMRWSPDGKKAAIIWTEIEDSQRKHRITWANSDGTDRHDLDIPYSGVKVEWLDNNWLAFVVSEKGYVETMDIRSTEQVYILGENGVTQTSDFLRDGDAVTFAQWKDNVFDIESTTRQGSRLFEFHVTDVPDYKHYDLNKSPKGNLGIVTFGAIGDVSLYLASADGQWSRELEQKMWLAYGLWSPDESAAAIFYQPTSNGPFMLDIVTSDGTLILRVRLPSLSGNPVWTRCD